MQNSRTKSDHFGLLLGSINFLLEILRNNEKALIWFFIYEFHSSHVRNFQLRSLNLHGKGKGQEHLDIYHVERKVSCGKFQIKSDLPDYVNLQ